MLNEDIGWIFDALRKDGVDALEFTRRKGGLPSVTAGYRRKVKGVSGIKSGHPVLRMEQGRGPETIALCDLGRDESKSLGFYLADYINSAAPLRTTCKAVTERVGRTMHWSDLEYYLNRIASQTEGFLSEGGNGWSPTCSPEDYDDEVIFSNDISDGAENVNMAGCNFFEVHFSYVDDNATGSQRQIVLNSFDFWF